VRLKSLIVKNIGVKKEKEAKGIGCIGGNDIAKVFVWLGC